MKQIKIFLILFCCILIGGCQDSRQTSTQNEVQNIQNTNTNILVVYFSQTGTTKKIAEYTSDILKTDIYEIIPETPYTQEDLNYNNTSSRATIEQNNPSIRPLIFNPLENIDNYQTIILCYPIWWGEAPKIIYTFLESYDFSNKTILPLCTSQSSDIGSSANNLSKLTPPSTTWLEGSRFNNQTTRNELIPYLNTLLN